MPPDVSAPTGRLDRVLAARLPLLGAAVVAVLAAGSASAVALQPTGALDAPVAVAYTPQMLAVEPAVAVPPVPVDVTPSPAAPKPSAAPVPRTPSTAARPAGGSPAPVPVRSTPAASPSPAGVDRLCSGDGWQQRRGAAALATLRRPSDAAAFAISYEPARPDVIGLATLGARRLQVFVRPCDQLSDVLLRHVVAHEMGHLVDATSMTPALRAQWLQERGIPAGTAWYGCSGCTDFATPAGDFAEVYAQWQAAERGNRSQLAPAPSAAQLAAIAAQFFG